MNDRPALTTTVPRRRPWLRNTIAQLAAMVAEMRRQPSLAAVKKMAAQPGSKVAVLPTAAPRQVRQTYNRQYHKAKAALPPWPGEYILPGVRAAMPTAKTIMETELTPALVLATAILSTLSGEELAKILGPIVAGAIKRSMPHEQALAAFKALRITDGARADLHSAMKRIAEQPLWSSTLDDAS